ncbi:MAG: MFS transporter, partial [Chloroflexota bacterium]
ALNQLAMNAPRFIGPALAGVVIAAAGVDVSYYVAGAAYGPVLLFTLLMEVPSRGTARNPERTLWSELGDGFRYVAGRRIVLVLLALSLVPTVFGLSFLAILPMFADRVLNAGPGGYGLLLSVFGVGAIAGGVVMASLGDFRFKGWFLLGTAFLFGVFLSGMAIAPWFPVTVAFLLLIGATGTLYRPVNNALLLTLTPPELHGRVMSMFLLDRGLMPLGSVLAGALADLANVSVAMVVLGALCAGLVALAAVVEPRVRSL